MEDLLFLSQRIPYPPTKGDKIRSWHILRYLASHYRVHLGCFIDDPYDGQFVPLLKELCGTINCEQLSPTVARLRSLAAIPYGDPMTIHYFGSRRLRAWVDNTVQRYRIGRAFVFSSAMAPYASSLNGATRLLDLVDIDSQKWLQYASASKPLARFIYQREGRVLLRFERQMAQLFDQTLLVSPAEADLFRQLAPECAERVRCVTNGVDLNYYSPGTGHANPYRSNMPAVVFTGAMDYRPNIEAAQWFVDAVMPEIARTGWQIEFWIVGANPAPTIQRLAERKRVKVTGRVEDIRPYLANAAAVVAPLLTARGIQNKVLEGMAMAKPVVLTSHAQEGISAVPGEEILVADGAEAFALQLKIACSTEGRVVGRRARHRVEADYGWSKSLDTIHDLLERKRPGGSSVSYSPARTFAQ